MCTITASQRCRCFCSGAVVTERRHRQGRRGFDWSTCRVCLPVLVAVILLPVDRFWSDASVSSADQESDSGLGPHSVMFHIVLSNFEMWNCCWWTRPCKWVLKLVSINKQSTINCDLPALKHVFHPFYYLYFGISSPLNSSHELEILQVFISSKGERVEEQAGICACDQTDLTESRSQIS